MKKKIKSIKLKIKGGYANPSPPIGPALGSVGINIMDFCNDFNKKTKNKKYLNKLIPIIINIYDDKSFDFIIKKQSIKDIVLNLLKIKKGSNEPNKKKVGEIDIKEIEKIAKYKLSDLNCFKINSAISMIKGTLKSIGIKIKNEKKTKNI
ncbi:MAG: 50S ribosomal protein L11 [Candidatus Shikimatogenerans bostrichidophilus]|nr:MAG: 50S ribosomal protein L11 [Candidatus Shikimatogenerans bostrichidophilus]